MNLGFVHLECNHITQDKVTFHPTCAVCICARERIIRNTKLLSYPYGDIEERVLATASASEVKKALKLAKGYSVGPNKLRDIIKAHDIEDLSEDKRRWRSIEHFNIMSKVLIALVISLIIFALAYNLIKVYA